MCFSNGDFTKLYKTNYLRGEFSHYLVLYWKLKLKQVEGEIISTIFEFQNQAV